MLARVARDEDAALSQLPGDAFQASGLFAFMYGSMTCPPNPLRDASITPADLVRRKDWISAVPLS